MILLESILDAKLHKEHLTDWELDQVIRLSIAVSLIKITEQQEEIVSSLESIVDSIGDMTDAISELE